MMNNYDESELNYLMFVLGYDLLHDYLENNVYYSDEVYDCCEYIIKHFLESKEYIEGEGLRYSTYLLLERWLRDNVITDKKCRTCGGDLLKSFIEGYDYQCYSCNEDYHANDERVVDDERGVNNEQRID